MTCRIGIIREQLPDRWSKEDGYRQELEGIYSAPVAKCNDNAEVSSSQGAIVELADQFLYALDCTRVLVFMSDASRQQQWCLLIYIMPTYMPNALLEKSVMNLM